MCLEEFYLLRRFTQIKLRCWVFICPSIVYVWIISGGADVRNNVNPLSGIY